MVRPNNVETKAKKIDNVGKVSNLARNGKFTQNESDHQR
jgi:hypothetical protein